jgi:hypothetical protein
MASTLTTKDDFSQIQSVECNLIFCILYQGVQLQKKTAEKCKNVILTIQWKLEIKQKTE